MSDALLVETSLSARSQFIRDNGYEPQCYAMHPETYEEFKQQCSHSMKDVPESPGPIRSEIFGVKIVQDDSVPKGQVEPRRNDNGKRC